MQNHLEPTALLDFHAPLIRDLILIRGWNAFASESDKIRAAYDFVRNEVRLGYNASGDIPASGVLADGYGQCNTKTTLLMALLRALGIPYRFHGATIDKELQRGAVTARWSMPAPDEILHSWAEVWFNGRWVKLECVILDDATWASSSEKYPSHCYRLPDLSAMPLQRRTLRSRGLNGKAVIRRSNKKALSATSASMIRRIRSTPCMASTCPVETVAFCAIYPPSTQCSCGKIRKGEANFDLSTPCAANRASVQ